MNKQELIEYIKALPDDFEFNHPERVDKLYRASRELMLDLDSSQWVKQGVDQMHEKIVITIERMYKI